MNFACLSEKNFSTRKKLQKKAVISEAAQKRKNFIDSHHFSVIVSSSGKCDLKVTKR